MQPLENERSRLCPRQAGLGKICGWEQWCPKERCATTLGKWTSMSLTVAHQQRPKKYHGVVSQQGLRQHSLLASTKTPQKQAQPPTRGMQPEEEPLCCSKGGREEHTTTMWVEKSAM